MRASSKPALNTVAVDIGGTGIKMMCLDSSGVALNERTRELTPYRATPDQVLAIVARMLEAQPPHHRLSVGFPGVVKHGVTHSAQHLAPDVWCGFELERALAELTQLPTRVINDAELQGYGVITGKGVELVLTLGTGLGAALYTGGHLAPNLELGHHPFRKKRTYEERVADAELARIGKRKWSARVLQMIEQIEPIWNYDLLYLGGGNAPKLTVQLPANVRLFKNEDGLAGGVRLWELD